MEPVSYLFHFDHLGRWSVCARRKHPSALALLSCWLLTLALFFVDLQTCCVRFFGMTFGCVFFFATAASKRVFRFL